MAILSDLTGGFFQNLSDLTPEGITDYFRRKTGIADLNIPDGNLAPMFDHEGQPLLKGDGSQLCLPYTHACVLVGDIMKMAGLENVKNTQEVAHLPVLFWRSTDIYLTTIDSHAIAAQRSNFNKNAAGLCLFAAAGYAKVIDGVAESSNASAKRELLEETGLSTDDGIVLKFSRMELNLNNPISVYPIQTNRIELPGRVPTVTEKYSVFTDLPYTEVLNRVRSNGESVGFLALPVDQMDTVENGGTITVSFAPAIETMLRMPFKNDDMRYLANIVRPGIKVADLREALPEVGRPQDYKGTLSITEGDAVVDAFESDLGDIIPVKFSADDVNYGMTSPLTFMKRAAQVWNLIPASPATKASEVVSPDIKDGPQR